MAHQGWRPEDIDTDTAHPARMYDFLLGGQDHYPVDREAAERLLAIFPDVRTAARANRAFMRRAVAAAARQGIRQFLDIGTGIPTSPNLQEVAQEIAPAARVVYTDNDPQVLVHARALLTGTAEGRTSYVHADLRHPEQVLEADALHSTLDLTRPVALCLLAVLHFMPDEVAPYGIVERLLKALPSGSMLLLSHATHDFAPEAFEELVEVYRTAGTPTQTRTRAEVARFFDGLDIVGPGILPVHRWNADEPAFEQLTDAEVSVYGGVAVKP